MKARVTVYMLAAMAVFALGCGIPGYAQDGHRLFSTYETPEDCMPQVDPQLVERQTLVWAHPEAVPFQVGSELILNLFEDVLVEATCIGFKEGPEGGRLWRGRVAGSEGGWVVLSVGDESVAGSVRIGRKMYHIRPLEGSLHVVRELAESFTEESRQPLAAYSVEYETAGLVNRERRLVGLYDLAWDDRLGLAARGHAEDMAFQNYFSHVSLDGRTPGDRITAAGYSWNACGENIAAGQMTPEEVMASWMNSAGHRANILTNTFCDIGVGYAYAPSSSYRTYWVQNFGRKQGVSACPPVINPPQPSPVGLDDLGWVTSFYVAYWGRCPDPEGQAYWLSQIEHGWLTAVEVAENFALSEEAKNVYPYFRSPNTATTNDRRVFVHDVYVHLFNREPDAEGMQYWVGELEKGHSTPGRLIGHVINAAMEGASSDWFVIRNKVEVGMYFAERLRHKMTPWSATLRGYAVEVLVGVGEDPASVQRAKDRIDTLLGSF